MERSTTHLFSGFLNRFQTFCGQLAFIGCGLIAATASDVVHGQSRPDVKRSAPYIVTQEYGLKGLAIDLNPSEIVAQSSGNAVSFPKALRKALESVMSDASNPTSPLAMALFEVAANPDRPDSIEATAREWHDATRGLYAHLNKQGARLRLAARNERAQRGEFATRNWIFQLSVPELSDQPFWIVVDKQGAKVTYTYGSR